MITYLFPLTFSLIFFFKLSWCFSTLLLLLLFPESHLLPLVPFPTECCTDWPVWIPRAKPCLGEAVAEGQSWRAGGAGRLWLELRVKGGLGWHNLCLARLGDWGKDKGRHTPYLRSRFWAQHVATQSATAWAWGADYLHPWAEGFSWVIFQQ